MGFKDMMKESVQYARSQPEAKIEIGDRVKVERPKNSHFFRNLFYVALVLCSVYVFYPKYQANNDIEAVKRGSIQAPAIVNMFFSEMSASQSANIGEGVAKIAGVSGSVDWKSFKPDKHSENKDVVCVQADIISVAENKKQQTSTFQFLYNRKSKYIELTYFGVNGKPKSKLDATMALQYGVL